MTPLRRRPEEDQYGAPQQSGGQWPPQPQQGFGDYQAAPAAAPMPGQGYHFPPPESPPAYGYSNPQLLGAQQWPQQSEPQPYDVAYQPYSDNDPSPFAGQAPHQHQGYGDGDGEFGDGYYEDEEPRRGRRWFLIAAALIGAIGVGGALAYTYRSIVAPKNGRVVAAKSEPVKVKVPSPVKVAEDPPAPPKAIEASLAEDTPPPGGGEQSPRKVPLIPVGPGGGQPPPTVSPPPPSIPGISVYQPKEKAVAPPSGRVVIGVPPPAPPVNETKETKQEEEPPPEAPPPPVKTPPKIAALPKDKAPTTPRPPRPVGSTLGFVAVLKSEKSSIEATKTLADLQQKYPEVLEGKSFDVQEADLSDRNLGTMYRVVVGPPGSHNAATALCTQLKAAGYVGCWVKEF